MLASVLACIGVADGARAVDRSAATGPATAGAPGIIPPSPYSPAPATKDTLWCDRPIVRIDLEGLRHSRPVIILRELSCGPGTPVDWTRLESDRLRLLDLGPFAEVAIGAHRDSLLDAPVLTVRVRERPTFLAYPTLELTPDAGLAYGAWAESQNFRGLNQSAGADVLAGGRGEVSLWFSTPWVGPHRLGVTGELYHTRARNRAADLEERHDGGDFSLSPSRGPWTSFPLALGVERVRTAPGSAPSSGADEPVSRHRWIQQGLWHDTRDSRARPRRGTVFGLSVAGHGGILGGNTSFQRYQWDWLKVLRVGREGAFTAASRLVWTRGAVPDYLRLGLGGATTLRGADEGEWSGDSRWFAWCEQRFPLVPKHTFSILHGRYAVDLTLDGALFLDAGTIWDGRGLEQGRAQGRAGVGAGLRLSAPFFRLLNADVATDGHRVRVYGWGGLRL